MELARREQELEEARAALTLLEAGSIPLFPAMGPFMQGLHAFEPQTKTVIDLESFMPDDHLLRDVDRLVAS